MMTPFPQRTSESCAPLEGDHIGLTLLYASPLCKG